MVFPLSVIFMVLLQILLSLFFGRVQATQLDSDLIAQSLIPLLEQTVQNLDRHRLRHLNGGLSATELSVLTAGERIKFESSAFRIFKENHIDGRRTLAEYRKDPIVKDVRNSFRLYSERKISLEALMRTIIHERFTVDSFLNDPELGYDAFHGFSRNGN
jgi:hypothetical protein